MVCALALIAIGIATIYGIDHPAESTPGYQTNDLADNWKKQLFFAGAGAAVFILINIVNYHRLGTLSYWLYGLVLLLLCLLLVDKYLINLPFVPVINNSRRWIKVGTAAKFIQIQPSELWKV